MIEYLYHGSPMANITLLTPQPARGIGPEEDKQKAVYATHIRNFAIPFALPFQADAHGNLAWQMDFEEDASQPRIDLQVGSLDLSGQGYLYILPAQSFTQIDEQQWVSYKSVKPVDAELIEALKYRFWIKGMKPDYTAKQGQYLAFIYNYTKVNGRPPAQADMQRYFKTTPPTVHQMIIKLEKLDYLSRVPGQKRALKVLLEPQQLPHLE